MSAIWLRCVGGPCDGTWKLVAPSERDVVHYVHPPASMHSGDTPPDLIMQSATAYVYTRRRLRFADHSTLRDIEFLALQKLSDWDAMCFMFTRTGY